MAVHTHENVGGLRSNSKKPLVYSLFTPKACLAVSVGGSYGQRSDHMRNVNYASCGRQTAYHNQRCLLCIAGMATMQYQSEQMFIHVVHSLMVL